MNEALVSHRGPGHLWLASLGQRGMALGLTRIQAMLQRLGQPDQQFPSVVVAGSDGKGSTSAMLTSLLREAGLLVGHYTSPHLVETRERVRVGATCVSAEVLDAALARVQTGAQDLEPTPFEALTAAALLVFADAKVDIAVLEVGLGGRLDAVNATQPIVSVITHLSHDHTAILGKTLQQIAWEKAAVARDGRILVAAQAVLVKNALRKHGLTPRLLLLGQHAKLEPRGLLGANWHQGGLISGPVLPEPLEIEIALPGAHQLENAALAILAYQGVAEWFEQAGRELAGIDTVVAALAESDWPCRAEVIATDPTVVLDAAHNPAGIAALAALLAERGNRWQIVLAVRKDRVAADLVRALAPVAAGFWLPRMAGETLLDAVELAQVVDAVAPGAQVAVASAERCLAQARIEAIPGCGVAVTGSQHALGEWLQDGVIASPRLNVRLGVDRSVK
jgi:dihydrofolate synthase/folylpolyglutamate synthase